MPKWLKRFLRTRTGRALFPLAACVDDAMRNAPPICADTGAPKWPGNCWNVRCQLGGTCCRAEQVAQAQAEEREAEAFVDAQWKAADEWLAAEWPHATDGERAVARSIWTELARRQQDAALHPKESFK